jgi:hypothetical protein
VNSQDSYSFTSEVIFSGKFTMLYATHLGFVNVKIFLRYQGNASSIPSGDETLPPSSSMTVEIEFIHLRWVAHA